MLSLDDMDSFSIAKIALIKPFLFIDMPVEYLVLLNVYTYNAYFKYVKMVNIIEFSMDTI